MITDKHKIIYATDLIGYENQANLLHEILEVTLGIDVPVSNDTRAKPTEYEILIGHTNRPLSQRAYEGEGAKRLMSHEIIIDGNSIQLACGGPHSARFAVLTLGKALAEGSLDSYVNKRVELTTEHVPHTEGTDARIMSINVLGQCYIRSHHNGKHPVSSERAEILAKLLVDYTPDLAGVQEMDVKFHAPLDAYFEVLKQHYGLEYAIALTQHGKKTNDCPIIYRADEYELDYENFVPANYHIPEKYNTMYPCGVASTKFTDKRDPTVQVAMISNHWHWEKEDVALDPPRQQIDADDLAATTKFLEETYPGVRVFSTGDFNSHRFQEKYFNRYLEAVDGAAADQIAIANGVHTPALVHMGYLIDHIVGKKGTFDVLLHAPTKNRSDVLTDHKPIYADIKFI